MPPPGLCGFCPGENGGGCFCGGPALAFNREPRAGVVRGSLRGRTAAHGRTPTTICHNSADARGRGGRSMCALCAHGPLAPRWRATFRLPAERRQPPGCA